jgi:hypothetical protein
MNFQCKVQHIAADLIDVFQIGDPPPRLRVSARPSLIPSPVLRHRQSLPRLSPGHRAQCA